MNSKDTIRFTCKLISVHNIELNWIGPCPTAHKSLDILGIAELYYACIRINLSIAASCFKIRGIV